MADTCYIFSVKKLVQKVPVRLKKRCWRIGRSRPCSWGAMVLVLRAQNQLPSMSWDCFYAFVLTLFVKCHTDEPCSAGLLAKEKSNRDRGLC